MKYYVYARVKFPVTDLYTDVYIFPVMLLFFRKTWIHHLWLSNLTTAFTSLELIAIRHLSILFSIFRQRLKTFLFRQSLPDIVLWPRYTFVVYAIVFAILATLKLWLTLPLTFTNCYIRTFTFIFTFTLTSQYYGFRCHGDLLCNHTVHPDYH